MLRRAEVRRFEWRRFGFGISFPYVFRFFSAAHAIIGRIGGCIRSPPDYDFGRKPGHIPLQVSLQTYCIGSVKMMCSRRISFNSSPAPL